MPETMIGWAYLKLAAFNANWSSFVAYITINQEKKRGKKSTRRWITRFTWNMKRKTKNETNQIDELICSMGSRFIAFFFDGNTLKQWIFMGMYIVHCTRICNCTAKLTVEQEQNKIKWKNSSSDSSSVCASAQKHSHIERCYSESWPLWERFWEIKM